MRQAHLRHREIISAALLEAGVNTFEIRARSRGSDVDDFEFVNVQIRLIP
jgi:hypothetical protein